MSKETLYLQVEWSNPTWYSWFRYQNGKIVQKKPQGIFPVIDSIYRHVKTGQLRVYSRYTLDGFFVSVNDNIEVMLIKRGRWGKLYLSY